MSRPIVNNRPMGDDRGLLGAMWRHRWTVVVSVLLATAAGVAYIAFVPDTYRATARLVMVDPRQEGVFRTAPAGDDTRRQQNRVDLFTSATVLERAASIAGSSMTLKELRGAVEVTPAVSADRIEVAASASRPGDAADLANAVVTAYEEVFLQEGLANARRTAQVLDETLLQLQGELDVIEEELAIYGEPPAPVEGEEASRPPSPSPGRLTLLTARRDAHVAMIRSVLITQQEALIDGQAARDIARVEPARAPTATSTKPMATLTLAALAGLVLGALLAIWRTDREAVAVVARPAPRSSGAAGPAGPPSRPPGQAGSTEAPGERALRPRRAQSGA